MSISQTQASMPMALRRGSAAGGDGATGAIQDVAGECDLPGRRSVGVGGCEVDIGEGVASTTGTVTVTESPAVQSSFASPILARPCLVPPLHRSPGRTARKSRAVGEAPRFGVHRPDPGRLCAGAALWS